MSDTFHVVTPTGNLGPYTYDQARSVQDAENAKTPVEADGEGSCDAIVVPSAFVSTRTIEPGDVATNNSAAAMRLPTILPACRVENGWGDTDDLPAHAWPGRYAIAYVCDDGEFLCAECVNDPSNPVHDESTDDNADGWLVVGYQTADWHDTGEGDWICAHCHKVIDPEPEPTHNT